MYRKFFFKFTDTFSHDKPPSYSRCQASCVAVSTAIALMLQKDERYLKKNGKFDIDSLVNECFLYASRILDKTRQVSDQAPRFVKKLNHA